MGPIRPCAQVPIRFGMASNRSASPRGKSCRDLKRLETWAQVASAGQNLPGITFHLRGVGGLLLVGQVTVPGVQLPDSTRLMLPMTARSRPSAAYFSRSIGGMVIRPCRSGTRAMRWTPAPGCNRGPRHRVGRRLHLRGESIELGHRVDDDVALPALGHDQSAGQRSRNFAGRIRRPCRPVSGCACRGRGSAALRRGHDHSVPLPRPLRGPPTRPCVRTHHHAPWRPTILHFPPLCAREIPNPASSATTVQVRRV